MSLSPYASFSEAPLIESQPGKRKNYSALGHLDNPDLFYENEAKQSKKCVAVKPILSVRFSTNGSDFACGAASTTSPCATNKEHWCFRFLFPSTKKNAVAIELTLPVSHFISSGSAWSIETYRTGFTFHLTGYTQSGYLLTLRFVATRPVGRLDNKASYSLKFQGQTLLTFLCRTGHSAGDMLAVSLKEVENGTQSANKVFDLTNVGTIIEIPKSSIPTNTTSDDNSYFAPPSDPHVVLTTSDSASEQLSTPQSIATSDSDRPPDQETDIAHFHNESDESQQFLNQAFFSEPLALSYDSLIDEVSSL